MMHFVTRQKTLGESGEDARVHRLEGGGVALMPPLCPTATTTSNNGIHMHTLPRMHDNTCTHSVWAATLYSRFKFNPPNQSNIWLLLSLPNGWQRCC